MSPILRQVLLGLGAIALQWLLLGRLKLWGAYPDLVLLFVAMTALRFGRVGGAVSGFLSGLAMDFLYGTWGIQMLVKTLVGFVVGLFRTEGSDPRLGPLRAFGGALAVALLHNGLFVVILALEQSTRTLSLITALWLGSALYTAAVAGLGALLNPRS